VSEGFSSRRLRAPMRVAGSGIVAQEYECIFGFPRSAGHHPSALPPVTPVSSPHSSHSYHVLISSSPLYASRRRSAVIRSALAIARASLTSSPEGTLNAAYNCLDRHFYANPDKTAIIYEADEASESREISFRELMKET
jgi:hypothetical protein